MQKPFEKAFSEMSFQERLLIVDSIRIIYPAFIDMLNLIEDYHLYNKKIEPDCVFIGADTGAGKSTLKDEYSRRYPPTLTVKKGAHVNINKVLSSSIPPKATILGTAGNLLRDLGDPGYNRGSIDTKTARLHKALEISEVELIILDELNHLYDRDSQKLLKLVADWLKTLTVETNIPIIALGLPTATSVFNPEVNAQLSRRFMRRVSLKPLLWDAEDNNSIVKFLCAVEESLPLMQPSNLFAEDMALRFFYATDGSIAHVMTLIRQGTRKALRNHQEFLDMSVFATVFDELIRNDKPHKQINPFQESFVKVEQEFMEESKRAQDKNSEQIESEEPGNRATNNRIKAGKQKTLGISDVL